MRSMLDQREAHHKELSDAVRAARREMRDFWTERAEELVRSAQEALTACETAATAGEQQADQRERVRKDLEHLSLVRSRIDQIVDRTDRRDETRLTAMR